LIGGAAFRSAGTTFLPFTTSCPGRYSTSALGVWRVNKAQLSRVIEIVCAPAPVPAKRRMAATAAVFIATILPPLHLRTRLSRPVAGGVIRDRNG
jgi:hypothetical protein